MFFEVDCSREKLYKTDYIIVEDLSDKLKQLNRALRISYIMKYKPKPKRYFSQEYLSKSMQYISLKILFFWSPVNFSFNVPYFGVKISSE